MRKKNYPIIHTRDHRKLSWAPLVYIRRDRKLYLEFNTEATKKVAKWLKIDLHEQAKYGMELSFNLASLELYLDLMPGLATKENENPFEANLTIMSSGRDQFRLNCAPFMRIPVIKTLFKYLDHCESDFGVLITDDPNALPTRVTISFNPMDQVGMILRLARPLANLGELDTIAQKDLFEPTQKDLFEPETNGQ